MSRPLTPRRARQRAVAAALQPGRLWGRPQRDQRARIEPSARADRRAWIRAGLIAGAVALGLVASPATLAARWSPSDARRIGGSEAQRLEGVRDRLQRSQALQAALRGRAGALAAQLEALRARRDAVSAALASGRQRARLLEQRLDQLVPRLLAREAEVRRHRAQTAHALAELASNDRRTQLDSTERARMLAISPLMLERLRRVETGLQSLRGRPERAIAQHARITRSMVGLTTARQRLASELAHKGKLEQVARARLRALDANVQVLAAEQDRLAGRLWRAEAAVAARAEPRADQPALTRLPGVRSAGVRSAAAAKGSLHNGSRLARAVEAEHRVAAGVLAAARADEAVGPASPGGVAGWPTMRSSAGPVTATLRGEGPRSWPSASHDAMSLAAPLTVAFDPRRRLFEGTAGPIYGSARPLVPVPEELQSRALLARGHPEMEVPAAPGQGIAAPVDGKVVFAGLFKSYGLLLIIEHEREYHTVLWGFARLDVSLGEAVQFGQVVGIMGARGDDPPVLHVERRRNGRPINLAATSSGIQG